MKAMKSLILGVLAVAAAWSVRGVERIAVDEVVTHYPWDGKVDCVTSLSGLEDDCFYKVAFTLSVKKEGETVRRTVTNDFTAVGSDYAVDGVFTNTFDCAALFGEGVYPNGGIAVDLIRTVDRTGEPIGITGDVLVINVSAGSEAETYPTKEISGVDLGTFNCDIYKTDKIVLLKVPAGTYYCQPRDSDENMYEDATQKLTTKGFYIGVFPVTQRQYERVTGKNPSQYIIDEPGNVAAQRPVDTVSWKAFRGGEEPGTEITASSGDSFLQRLVKKTGLAGFDLPTEAQWEMAARADSEAMYGAYWDGSAAVKLTESNCGEAAWINLTISDTMHAVGGKRPNLWGLYDTWGNISVHCRDVFHYHFDTAYVDAPYANTSGYGSEYDLVVRGAYFFQPAGRSPPSKRTLSNLSSASCWEGFRLSKPLH